MNKDDIQFTKDWWSDINSDPERFEKFLVKLRNTEYGGFTDYLTMKDRWCSESDRAALRIFKEVADDEERHAKLLDELVKDRKIIAPSWEITSQYWPEMYKNIDTLKSCAAVNFFGEALAADRFEILLEHPSTPSDFREALKIILPEEQFHREALGRLAGEEEIERLRPMHDATVAMLKKK